MKSSALTVRQLVDLLIAALPEDEGETAGGSKTETTETAAATEAAATLSTRASADARRRSVLDWPPDVFALTSFVLRSTGAYRFATSPAEPWPLAGATYPDDVRKAATEWLDAISTGASTPAHIDKLFDQVCQDQAVDEICRGRRPNTAGDCVSWWCACSALLELHAIADTCCAGFGTPASPRTRNALQFLADQMVATYGSLTRLPRALGVVLPKMRTPQTGVTLRSLSLYATWHQTEVDAVWRSMPWQNADENTINALLLPWPFTIPGTAFAPLRTPFGRKTLGQSNFFSFEPAQTLEPKLVLDLMHEAMEEVSRVHAIVIPELSIRRSELNALKDALACTLPSDQVPVIIAGMHHDGPECTNATDAKVPEERCNRLVFCAYFAERWYEWTQAKHHRWSLSTEQVMRYQLAGRLAGPRNWLEGFSIEQRRLLFLAPNGWLSLCPLICEDLAQLEPVSELIRGVGPTLVLALLLDGPQRTDRWAARYASVLADDPGSSILTLTSLGMALRSGGEQPRQVGLWKDAEQGWRPINLPENHTAAVLTIRAGWHTEYTTDGRTDDGAAARFVYSGIRYLTGAERKRTDPEIVKSTTQTSIDLYELTTFAQLVDAVLDAAPEEAERIFSWLQCSAKNPKDTAHALEQSENTAGIVSAPRGALDDILHLIEGHRPAPFQPDFLHGVSLLQKLLHSSELLKHQAPTPAGTGQVPTDRATVDHYCDPEVPAAIERWTAIANHAMATIGDCQSPDRLNERSSPRTSLAYAVSLLWAVHNRLLSLRKAGGLTEQGAELLEQVERAPNYKGQPIGNSTPWPPPHPGTRQNAGAGSV